MNDRKTMTDPRCIDTSDMMAALSAGFTPTSCPGMFERSDGEVGMLAFCRGEFDRGSVTIEWEGKFTPSIEVRAPTLEQAIKQAESAAKLVSRILRRCER